MSNVRPRRKHFQASSENSLPCISALPQRGIAVQGGFGAGRFSDDGARSDDCNAVGGNSGADRSGVEHTRTIQIPFQSASALQAPPRANVSQFVGAGAVAPARSACSGHNGAVSNAQVRLLPSPTSYPAAAPRPNPSIERTHNGGAQCLAPSRVVTPLCAAHVKR